MKVKKTQVFNLMDTNGRRNDVINAVSGYLSILDSVRKSNPGRWEAMPASMIQYDFYKSAIELSSDVFSRHEPYDSLKTDIYANPEFRRALEGHDIEWIHANQNRYRSLIEKFDKGIEDRARHYTSNLVKLGLTDDERRISQVGELMLNNSSPQRDRLERLLPIDGINLIYLRQMLKLRIFDQSGEHYYSPFNMAIYLLLKKKRLSEKIFFEIIQGLDPYFDFDSIDTLIDTYNEGDILTRVPIQIPDELRTDDLIEDGLFGKYFKNQKSKNAIETYRKFYRHVYMLANKKTEDALAEMLECYEANRAMLNKAFGCGKMLFAVKKGERPRISDFLKKYEKLFSGNININIYIAFNYSKKLDVIREYSDTTRRIFNATGIIKFNHGYVELAYQELSESIFNQETAKRMSYGILSDELSAYYEDYSEYEEDINSYYCSVFSLNEICSYDNDETEAIFSAIRDKFTVDDIYEISNIVANNREKEFAEYISENYPESEVKEILGLFGDRNNDIRIKERVSPDADVPTIYEYIVGIAWYYFSGRRIRLLESFNLTLSANFEPLIHAGGGQGDIVIRERDRVVMLEVTLMNANAQKRGEWEPVLRHAVNLKIEEETNQTKRSVTTFFIADKFDNNTINIWKAIASVPMESSVQKGRFTDNVVIMPLNNDELCRVMDHCDSYDNVIDQVHNLFEIEKSSFDLEWRDKLVKKITQIEG